MPTEAVMFDMFDGSYATDTLFAALSNQSANLETLSNQALSSGIDSYMKQDYKKAAKEFKRAVGLSPYSGYSIQASKYLAMSYQKLDQVDKAIDTYQQAIKLHPDRDELYLDLGNLYFGQQQYVEAEEAYRNAVRIMPSDPNSHFALGQAYLAQKKFDAAETEFTKVSKLIPDSPNGYFGLGQTFSAQGKYTEAISQFDRAISKKRDFYDAYLEMGYAYADAGQMDKARQIKQDLERREPSLAALLSGYMNRASAPKMLFAWATGSFKYYLPPKTTVAALDEYLSNSGASQTFSMIFQFDKEMDRESVENRFNWSISRATGKGMGGDYNYGLSIPTTEVNIAPYPTDVFYDPIKRAATVWFRISQNSTADGTIDPSHIEFKFSGKDVDGNLIDPGYDQYTGFSRVY